MAIVQTRTRRELVLFGLLAALPAIAIAALYHLHPWRTPIAAQGANFQWGITAFYLALGAAGIAMSPWTRASESPGLDQGRRWTVLVLCSIGVGALYGLTDLAINRLTPWGAHLAAVDQRNGYDWSFINVHPPWSLLHYFHASIISECAFRLAPILFFGGLIGLFVRGRGREATFWLLAVLAAMIEPLEKSVMLRKWALFGDADGAADERRGHRLAVCLRDLATVFRLACADRRPLWVLSRCAVLHPRRSASAPLAPLPTPVSRWRSPFQGGTSNIRFLAQRL